MDRREKSADLVKEMKTEECTIRAVEPTIFNREIAFQNEEKEERVAEWVIAYKEPTFQYHEQVFEEDYLTLLDDKARNYLHSTIISFMNGR